MVSDTNSQHRDELEGGSPPSTPADHPFNVHRMMLDLRPHKARLYWGDLLACASVFWTLAMLGSKSGHWLLLSLSLGSLALYRMVLFTHEICHCRRRVLPGFECAWNALCGVPLLLPSYMLKSHASHHVAVSFGTQADPEYLPFASYPQLRRSFLWGSALVPIALTLRALVLVPLACLLPKVRTTLRARFTFMAMNGGYRPGRHLRLTKPDLLMEAAASMWVWGLMIASVLGWVSWRFGALLLACMALANLLNGWRTLRAHRYTSQGQAMDLPAQLRDSTTFTGHWLWQELLCPVGQRFHAAHHLLPYLPYHALPEAHRRLVALEWPGKPDYLATFTSQTD
jgi:fatty acid desaturase